MPINYTIQADVYDIGADTPVAGDRFLVDTNVWFWMTYTNAGHGEPAWRAGVMSAYAAYVNAATAAGADLRWSGLSFAELAHLIEKTEREIFEGAHGPTKAKEYRHNHPAERTQVGTEIQSAWAQVKTLAQPATVTIDEPTTDAALTRCLSQTVDGYDLFLLESMSREGMIQVITDDGDFGTVPGIQVFTANRNVIQAAHSQGRLSSR